MLALVTDHAWSDVDIERRILAEAGVELVEAPSPSESTLLEMVEDVSAILTCWAPVGRQLIARGRRLRVVARMGVGLDNIDLQAAADHEIVVTNVPDYCVEEVSDHVVAFVHAWARGILPYDREIRKGRWAPGSLALRRVSDLTIGVVGLGNIGSRVAAKFHALGARVLGHDPASRVGLQGVERTDRDAVLALADVVTLHLPLVDNTRNLVDAEFLASMRRGSLLVNTARGGLVDTAALIDALATRLGAAALDVIATEPDVPASLLAMPNVLLTPHVAFSSDLAVQELRRRSAIDVARVLTGAAPHNPVDLPPPRKDGEV